MQYSYNEAELALLAGEDFLKGMSWLIQQNPAALNSKVVGLSDKLMPIESLPEPFDPRALKPNYDWHVKKDMRFLRLLLLNGWLFPANRNVTIEVNNPPIRYFYRAKKALKYDIQTGKGIVAQKDYRRAGHILLRWAKFGLETWRKFDKAADSYQSSRDEVITEKFWRGYLGF